MGAYGVTEEMANEIDHLRKRLNRIRKHRLVFYNIYPKKGWIEAEMKKELGRVRVVSWRLEHDVSYQGMVVNGGMMPQRIMIFLVRYREG